MESLYKKLRSGSLTPEQVLAIINGTEEEKAEGICFYEEGLSSHSVKEQVAIEDGKTVLFISQDIDSIRSFRNSGISKHVNCISVYLSHNECINMECNYQLNLVNKAEYINLYKQLNEKHLLPDYLIYYSNSRESKKKITTQGIDDSVTSAFAVTQIIKVFSQNHYSIQFIHAFKEEQSINYEGTAIAGMLKTIALEYPNLIHKTIRFKNMNEQDINNRLTEEINFKRSDGTNITYISNKRFYNEFHPIHSFFSKDHKKIDNINQGVFIITGGTGALGKILAEELLTNRPQRLYLLGRRHYNKDISDSIQQLDSSGVLVKYIQCDIEDSFVCDQIVANILEQEGHITGLFHCAGVIQDKMMINIELNNFKYCVNPKIKGLLNLFNAFVKYARDVKFVKLYSSITSMLGNIGQTAYSFANGYLNAIALDEQSPYHMLHIQSICWPYWEHGGKMVDEKKLQRLYIETGQKPLNTADGKIALRNILNMECKCPIVLSGDKAKISKYMVDARKQKTDVTKNIRDQAPKTVSREVLTKEKITSYIQGIISDIIKLPISKLNVTTTWDNYGIDSLTIMRFNEVIEEVIPDCPKTLMYEYRNIESLSQYFFEKHAQKLETVLKKNTIQQQKVTQPFADIIPSVKLIQKNRFSLNKEVAISQDVVQPKESQYTSQNDIAIIGIAGRYPKAKTLEEFWRNLLDGKDCIVEIPKERWDYREDYNPDKNQHGYTNSKWGGFIDESDCFDAAFFKVTPREARYMDPQERIFLECAWHGLEDAGYTHEMLQEYQVGVFAGIMYSHYQLYGIDYKKQGDKRAFNSSYASVANRVSYHMDFHGPSIAIDTMCSSSLTAIYLACESILNGTSSLAIAGGVNLSLHPNKYINLSQNNFLSSEGKCRSFGEGGDGYVPSEGVGTVVLKRLEDAQRDRDMIYGVVKAAAINHGGRSNGFTVPNPASQTAVIEAALKQGHVDASNITFVETHGTGTPLGDPIELSALTKAYGITTKCPIGSVKSNMGHAESAAGMIGLTKILLQMKYKKLVPSIHCDQLNKNINFNEVPFYVQNKVEAWEHKKSNGMEMPYLAGLSAFGAGGSNAHLLIEEYNSNEQVRTKLSKLPYHVLFISAKSKKDLLNYCRIYEEFLIKMQDDTIPLEQICYATQYYRNTLGERVAIIGENYQDIINKIQHFITTEKAEKDIIYLSEDDRLERYDEIQKEHYVLNQQSSKSDFIDYTKETLYEEHCEWSIMWGGIQYPKIHLPLYPFERKHYWLSEDWEKQSTETQYLSRVNLYNRLSNLSTLDKIKWKSFFSTSDFFVKDHKVNGKQILPGAAIVLNAKAIGDFVSDGRLKSVDQFTFVSPVSFDKDEVELILYIDKKTLEIKIKLMKNAQETTVGIGTLNIEKEKMLDYVVDIEAVNRRCSEKIESRQLYASIKQHGLEYGKSLGIIDNIVYSDDEAIVMLKATEENYIDYFETEMGNSMIPCIDAAFQSVFVFGRHFGLNRSRVMLPYKMGSISCRNMDFIPKFVYVKCNREKDITFDIQICDKEGRVQIQIGRLSMMELKEQERDVSSILELLEKNEISLERAAAILEEQLYD